MSDPSNPAVEPGASPVMMTGEVVINGRKDVTEIEGRAASLGPNQIVHVAHIARGDLVFARKGKMPINTQGFGDTETAVDAFAAFDGVTHTPDNNYVFLGVSRNPPMHQDTPGHELAAHVFAIQIGGSRTIEMRSAVAIPKCARIAWRIPRTDGLMPDRTHHGRVLAELFEFKTSEISVKPAKLHGMIKRVLSGKLDTSNMHISDRAPFTNASRIWEAIQAIAFSSAVVYAESSAGAGGLSDDKKLEMAEHFGLVTPKSTDGNRDQKMAKSKVITQRLLDVVFQCEQDAKTGISYPSSNVAAFRLHDGGQLQPDVRKKQVATRQMAQFETVFDTMVTVYDDAYSRVIGMCVSGGVPNGVGDVVLKRVA